MRVENTSQDSISQHLIIRELKGIREALECLVDSLTELKYGTNENEQIEEVESIYNDDIIKRYESKTNRIKQDDKVRESINDLPLVITDEWDDFIPIQELYVIYLKRNRKSRIVIGHFSKLLKEQWGLTPSVTKRVQGKPTRGFVGIKWRE